MNVKRFIVVGVIPALLILLGVAVFHQYGAAPLAERFCDSGTIRYYANIAQNDGDTTLARYRTQEADICEGKDANATVPDQKKPYESTKPEKKANEIRKVFYYANEPLAAPEWLNSFAGDPIARKPELKGKQMEKLTADEAVQELLYRIKGPKSDPMLSVATAMALGIIPQMNEAEQQRVIAGLAANFNAWDKLNSAIENALKNDFTISVETLSAGTWCSTFSYGGAVPLIVEDCTVNRTTPFVALKLTRKSNGEVIYLRLACGFQRYWHGVSAPEVPQAPAPTPGFSRTPEGVPTPPTGGGPGTTTPETPPPGTTTPPTTTPPTTTPPTTTPPTTTPPTTTPPPETCPPGQHGTPPLCKDDPSDGPAHNPQLPPQQKPNPLPASPSHAQPTRPAPPPATYQPPATTRVVPPANQGGPTTHETPRVTPTREAPAPKPEDPATGCIPAPGKTCP